MPLSRAALKLGNSSCPQALTPLDCEICMISAVRFQNQNKLSTNWCQIFKNGRYLSLIYHSLWPPKKGWQLSKGSGAGGPHVTDVASKKAATQGSLCQAGNDQGRHLPQPPDCFGTLGDILRGYLGIFMDIHGY